MIFDDSPINLRITCGKYCINFKENSWDVWNLGYFDEIFGKLRKNYEEILEKLRR